MFVRCVENLAELAPYRHAWDALAGDCVFKSATWLAAWWRHYGAGYPQRRLAVWLALARQDASADALVAALPCYLETTWTRGPILRLLGDGEVCSDHL
ncbi:MAG: hypothetical protein DCC67_19505, partial [Planctomycetota bacterium]